MTARSTGPLLVLAAGTTGLTVIALFLWPFNTVGECGAGGGECPAPVSHALVGYALALAPAAAQTLALSLTAAVLLAGVIGFVVTTRPR